MTMCSDQDKHALLQQQTEVYHILDQKLTNLEIQDLAK